MSAKDSTGFRQALDKTITANAAKLTQVTGMASERATLKAEYTIYGKVILLLGVLLCGVAGALGLVMVLKNQPLTFVAAAFAAIPAGLGVLCIALGAHLMARDLSPLLSKLAELAVSIIKARKGQP